jgi:hypothetical protein
MSEAIYGATVPRMSRNLSSGVHSCDPLAHAGYQHDSRNSNNKKREIGRMAWRSVSTTVVVLMAMLLRAGAACADESQLPDDPAKDMLLKNCADCHNLDVVTGKHQSSADWKSTITRMSGYGINMPGDEIDHLTEYLARVQGLAPARPRRP